MLLSMKPGTIFSSSLITHESFKKSDIMGMEAAIYILQSSQFSQTSIEDSKQLKEIRIYASHKIIGINKADENIEIEGLAEHFQANTSPEKLQKYFQAHFLRLSQYNDGSYKCQSHARGLGGGGSSSKLEQPIKDGDIEEVRTKINAENVNMRFSNGDTPLTIACSEKGGSPNLVELLIKVGANINLKQSSGKKHSPLTLAAVNGHTNCIDLLLKAGADVHISDKKGRTALWYASIRGNSESVALLIKAGSNLNIKGVYNNGCQARPIENAIRSANIQSIKLLVEAGADFGPSELYLAKLYDKKIFEILNALDQPFPITRREDVANRISLGACRLLKASRAAEEAEKLPDGLIEKFKLNCTEALVNSKEINQVCAETPEAARKIEAIQKYLANNIFLLLLSESKSEIQSGIRQAFLVAIAELTEAREAAQRVEAAQLAAIKEASVARATTTGSLTSSTLPAATAIAAGASTAALVSQSNAALFGAAKLVGGMVAQESASETVASISDFFSF